jgi:hypothetical protein
MAQNSQEAQALKITLHSDIGLFDVHYLSRVGSTPVLRWMAAIKEDRILRMYGI